MRFATLRAEPLRKFWTRPSPSTWTSWSSPETCMTLASRASSLPCFSTSRWCGSRMRASMSIFFMGIMTRRKLIKQLRPPSNVHIFKTNEPQTFRIESLKVALHGQGFATSEITEDLAASYPPGVPHWFNIGVLHTNLAGAAEHANYAPCSMETLKNKGYQYWALGHIHNREILCSDPYVVYPGNIQGRHGKEQGEKSCELVTVSDAGAISLQTVSTSVLPWIEIQV